MNIFLSLKFREPIAGVMFTTLGGMLSLGPPCGTMVLAQRTNAAQKNAAVTRFMNIRAALFI